MRAALGLTLTVGGHYVTDKLVAIVEAYFAAIRDVRSLGAGTKERSFYPALAQLLNAVGQELQPKVLCLSDLGNTGAGHPDFGLFSANQVQHGEPRRGQVPERGVIEVKGLLDDAWLTANTEQVSKYFGAYKLVVVTNLRDFLIIGEGPTGAATKMESFRLAPDYKAFLDLIASPRKSAAKVGAPFAEYLRRAMTQSVALTKPKDLAWFLASYARDALHRVDEAGNLPALNTLKSALEDSLGVSFSVEKGVHFFRSTLVQTMFYGVFSAWALWAREVPRQTSMFDWRTAIWHLNVPFVRTLFQQLSSPEHLQPLHLVEVLDWTAATLNRVDSAEFFTRFSEADAVQYFYEPFLEAFDPELRKELGVWYTPREVVDYMVARIDNALENDLGVPGGLASESVFVLDPCCGTGAFLAATLRRIDSRLKSGGYGALRGQMVKKAALERVFGFEIMPAPFVVAHLQAGLVLKSLGAPLDAASDRAGIYLTNALTGWEAVNNKPLPFPELEEERTKADTVKQTEPILVILGNPPYNGYAGMAVDEERSLSTSYRTTKDVRAPEGQGLNDLYVRFYRMAERRIAERTGRGIVSFITNFEWLRGMSHPGMRERLLEVFGTIRIDNLNGDSRETGKTTPQGLPDPSIFSTEHNREGIRKGTAIATLIRHSDHLPAEKIGFRHLWGAEKRQQLVADAETPADVLYVDLVPQRELGLPFFPTSVGEGYLAWPSLTDYFPVSFPGVKTSRDEFLVSVDREELDQRINDYFDPLVSHADLVARYGTLMTETARYDPIATRETLLKRGRAPNAIVKYAYRPFDVRWLYLEPETKLVDEKRPEYWPHVSPTNPTLAAQQKPRGAWQSSQVIQSVGCLDLIDRGSSNFPQTLVEVGTGSSRPNLAASIIAYLNRRDLKPDIAFFHVLACLHAPKYAKDNSDALQMGWPRVPLPSTKARLEKSAKLGEELSHLLNPEVQVPGVSAGVIPAGLSAVGEPYKADGSTITAEDLAVTAGWGAIQYTSKGSRTVMPGRGLYFERAFSDVEAVLLEDVAATHGISSQEAKAILGNSTFDIHLSADVMWRNIPKAVWNYRLGGYQVIKKWLSYRDRSVINRSLTVVEVNYVSAMARRIASILLMGSALDANYIACSVEAVEWDDRPLDPMAVAAGQP